MSPDDAPPGDIEAAEPLVCIVDDDEGIRDALGWLLRSRGLASVSFPERP